MSRFSLRGGSLKFKAQLCDTVIIRVNQFVFEVNFPFNVIHLALAAQAVSSVKRGLYRVFEAIILINVEPKYSKGYVKVNTGFKQ